MPAMRTSRTIASAAGFGFFLLLLVLAQVADVQKWDPPNLDQQTLPPLLRIVSTVGLLVATWSLLTRKADDDGTPETP